MSNTVTVLLFCVDEGHFGNILCVSQIQKMCHQLTCECYSKTIVDKQQLTWSYMKVTAKPLLTNSNLPAIEMENEIIDNCTTSKYRIKVVDHAQY